MKQEYKEKLKLVKKMLHESLYVESDELGEKMFDDGYNLMKELVITKDINVLSGLFDLFTEENENGICESLQSQVYQHYTMEKVISALYEKFSTLIVNNEMRAVQFAGACLNTSNFEKFRDIFNQSKSDNSESFLHEFTEWYGEDYPEEIAVLREDMKKW
jgi:hypothetical protein